MVVGSLVNLLEILSIVFCIHYLYGEKPHFEAVTVCFILFEVTWMSGVYYLGLGPVWSVTMYPFVALYCALRFGTDIKAIFLNNILYMSVLTAIQATVIRLYCVTLKIERLKTIDNLIINIVIFVITIGILRKCNLKRLSDVLKNREKLIVSSVFVMAAGIVLSLLAYKQNTDFDGLYYAVLGVGIILIVIVAVDIGKHRMKVREAEAELRMHKLYDASFGELIDDIRARQHEFDNHINTIYSQHHLYKTYDELVEAQEEYFGGVETENRYNKLVSKEGNRTIQAFLYGKFSQMEKRGIKIEYRVNIRGLESAVPVYKIVVLLGNLMDNAADAAERNGTGMVGLVMLEKPEQIEIEVYNESEEINIERRQKFFEKRYSEKGTNRGYGLYNVKKICNEYGIEIICDNKEIDGKNCLVFKLKINKTL